MSLLFTFILSEKVTVCENQIHKYRIHFCFCDFNEFVLFYNFIEFIILLYTFFVISFARYKEYVICFISFSKFSDVLPAFTCGSDIVSFVENILFLKAIRANSLTQSKVFRFLSLSSFDLGLSIFYENLQYFVIDWFGLFLLYLY